MMQNVTVGSVRVVMITPSPFSAGWLMNPNFCAAAAAETVPPLLETRTEICSSMAAAADVLKDRRQDGGAVMATTRILAQSLRRLSAGRLASSGRTAHAFSFAKENNNDEGDGDDGDDWEKYIGARRGQSLAELQMKWDRLRRLGPRRKQDDDDDDDKGSRTDHHRLGPLGYVFGGRRVSQVEHIRILAGDVLARLREVEGRSSAGVLFTGTTGENGHEVKKILDECLAAAAGRDNDSSGGGGEHDGDDERLVQLFDIVEYAATVVRLGDVLVDMRCSQRPRAWDMSGSPSLLPYRRVVMVFLMGRLMG